MGGTVTKSGVAVDGKAATDPANGKANGQVSTRSDRGSISRLAAWLKVEEIRLGAWLNSRPRL